jgi:hypothetical protein
MAVDPTVVAFLYLVYLVFRWGHYIQTHHFSLCVIISTPVPYNNTC